MVAFSCMCLWNNVSKYSIFYFFPTNRIFLNSISGYSSLRDISQMMVHSKILCLNVPPSNPNLDHHDTKIRMDQVTQSFSRFFVMQTSMFLKHNQFVLFCPSEANLRLLYPLQNQIKKDVSYCLYSVGCYLHTKKLSLVGIVRLHVLYMQKQALLSNYDLLWYLD